MVTRDRSDEHTEGPPPRRFVQRMAELFWPFVVLGVLVGLVLALVIGEHYPDESRATVKVVLFLGSVVLVAGVAGGLWLLLGAEFEEAMRRRRAAKEARLLCQETRRILKRQSYRE